MFYTKKIFIATGLLVTGITVFISCINNTDKHADVRGPKYAGDATCISCHKNVYDFYLHSAHKNTSRLASRATILGSFTSPENEFVYNAADKVVMEQKGNDFYQTEYKNNVKAASYKFDISVGSGRKAQTYLFKKGDEIHQLPVSYFVPSASWANSPGFFSDRPYFDRNIPSGCFGCHASAANVEVVQTGGVQLSEKFISGGMLLGIDCERCHGPAKEHVDYHTEHPGEKIGKYITDIRTLSRNQKMDMCGVCHSGIKKAIQPVSNFKPGDKLEDFYYPSGLRPDVESIDVHGTQVQFIMASQCYIKSNNLTCTSCHDPHQKESSDLALFSQRCMNCHTEANHNFCKMAPQLGEAIKANCIDCHMPTKPSKVIQLLTNGTQSPLPDFIRTHVVAVYPEETQKVLAMWKSKE
jgi:hypothetical protein